MVKAYFDKQLEQRFIRNKIFLAHPRRIGGVYKYGEMLQVKLNVEIEAYATLLKHSFINIGAWSYSLSKFPEDTSIGRYCSIAKNTSRMGEEHPTDWVSTNAFSYSKQIQDLVEQDFDVNFEIVKFRRKPESLTIGNDVWIGRGCQLKGGITIGDGAVIAAGAIVTKDVEPYTIVGGIPAKPIRKRFSDDVIERLLSLKWWEYGHHQFAGLDFTDPDRFADDALSMVEKRGLEKWNPGKVDVFKLLNQARLRQSRNI